MNEKLIKYRITPRVVKAGAVTTVTVKGLDTSEIFYDDLVYTVKITRQDNWSYQKDSDFLFTQRDCSSELVCTPKDGVITFSHLFSAEGLFQIDITREKNEKHIPEHYSKYGWGWRVDAQLLPLSFQIYALEEDLYGTRPYKGDLHMHSCGSDGEESPAMTAAQYRKGGYDFIAITDHYRYEPSLSAIEAFEGLDTGMKLFPGEEIHPKIGGVFHVVSFAARKSVNTRVQTDPERVEREVSAVAETLSDVADEKDRRELAWFKWICDAVREAGGVAIYPHPYWVFRDAMNVRSVISEEILRRGFADVYEMMGGTTRDMNRMQAQLYYEMCMQRGGHFPIVASTDTHAARGRGIGTFDLVWTMTFATDTAHIPDSIRAGKSVAIDNYVTDSKTVYGELRLVKYAYFLLENYYESHDALANAAGQAILRYVLGDKTQKKLVGLLEDELRKYDHDFFG